MKRIIILLLTLFLFIPRVLAAEDLTPNSKSGILIDATSGEILFQKNVHEKLAPASMTKTMTMLLVMEAIEAGKIDYNDMIVVSENASSMGGSQIFLETNSKIRLSELLKGVAIASANDAAVALAEVVGGTTANFVEIMNNRARELGATNTNFKNPHGLDDADHYSTAYDMSLMARELVKHEKILEYTRIYEDYLKKPDGTSTWLVNTNKVVC